MTADGRSPGSRVSASLQPSRADGAVAWWERALRLQLRGQPRIWPPHRVDRTAFPFHPKAAWPREPFAGAEWGRPARILSMTIFPVDSGGIPAACFCLRWFFRRASATRKLRGKPGVIDPKWRSPAGAAPATVSGERSPPLPLEPRLREGEESASARGTDRAKSASRETCHAAPEQPARNVNGRGAPCHGLPLPGPSRRADRLHRVLSRAGSRAGDSASRWSTVAHNSPREP